MDGPTGLPALVPVPLPRPPSSFIGRRRDLDELEEVVATHRLVTLVAMGGAGKTRLAIELAQRLGRSSSPVAFADLSAVRDLASVAEAIGLSVGLARGASDDLTAVLGDAALLLVIDNAEHVVAVVAGLVQELIARCPNVRILVTSREPLALGGETCWRLPALRLPPPGLSDPDELATYDAVDLFTVRARETGANLRLTAENAPRVVAICQQLDGIPLALELAAARVVSLGLDQIQRQLRRGLQVLSSSRRDALSRHATMEAAIAWSFELLDPADQRLFSRLSVFVGTFDLDAVAAVCAAGERVSATTIDLIQRLVDRSMLVPCPRNDGGMRYRMLEVVRHFAAEALPDGDEPSLSGRHARHYCELVGTLSGHTGTDSNAYLRGVEAEWGNVQRALEWAAANSADMDVEFAVRLSRYWALSGLVREGRERIHAVIGRRTLSVEHEAALRTEACRLALMADDLDDATACIEGAMALRDRLRDPDLGALMLHHRAGIRMRRGDLAGADEDLSRAIGLTATGEPKPLAAWITNSRACLLLESGRHEEALAAALHARDLIVRAGDHPLVLAQIQFSLGSIYLAEGRSDDAYDAFSDALRCAAQHNLHHTAADYLRGLAVAASDVDDAELCLQLLGAAARSSGTAGSAGFRRLRAFGLPTDAAERRSRLRLGSRAAAAAWANGMAMDLTAVTEWAANRRHRPAAPSLVHGTGDLVIAPTHNDRLRRARQANDWTQQDLARRLGTTKLTVSRWERGIHTPTLYFRSRLCSLFGMSAHELGLSTELDALPTATVRDKATG